MNEVLEKTKLRKAVAPLNVFKRDKPLPDVWVDDSRDDLLKPFSKATLDGSYVSPGEKYQDRFANYCRAYADDEAHAQRMYDYVSQLLCTGSTPVVSNGGTTRGLTISCYLNTVPDSMDGIIEHWGENARLGSRGGGLGSYWGKVRSIGEQIGLIGKTSGALSFMKVSDAKSACISQGSTRRASEAVFLDISHPEILQFVEMRQKNGGDPDKKCLNLHHGVVITDAFMEAAINGEMWDLVSPHTGLVVESIDAQALFEKIVEYRMANGEPYIMFKDTVNRYIPEHHKKSKLYVSASNLCQEITLPTGVDHHGIDRTAVCALFQINAEKYDVWSKIPGFLEDIARFMDNLLQDYIDNAGEDFVKARYSAMRERSIAVGHFGIHSLLQSKGIPVSSPMGLAWSTKIAKTIKEGLDEASVKLAHERGACPDAAEHGIMERFSNKTALAPTASVSIICGGGSPGGDWIIANIYTHKTQLGSFEVRNPHLEKVLESHGKNTKEIWKSIEVNQGSVQHLDFLTLTEKEVYLTAFEIDPRLSLEYTRARGKYICQSQSLNLFLRPDMDRYDLLMLHILAWKYEIKTMYYLRSFSIQMADTSDGTKRSIQAWKPQEEVKYEECIFCM